MLGMALVLSGSGALSACSDTITAHGNLPTAESMAMVEPGTHTRADVQALLGTPSATSMYGGETWYYISNQTQQMAFLKPDELTRTVLAVEFDPSGMVSDVRTLTKDDGQTVDIVQRETPTRGTESSIIQELFGNIGRFSPNTDNL
ncbi:MAG: outer membrane protein assembly factor BamE [Rhodospirillum sp.]|nr:outer membrane protein assembly factor BamE [Rhodospirillum sp.]MCF8487751.1 outer membrane protein assembly factor BamE [Rhodospirillum sp.]MCF8502819.1 outer membrane protein assembly factor BamE [Rhodospirillum sp.]